MYIWMSHSCSLFMYRYCTVRLCVCMFVLFVYCSCYMLSMYSVMYDVRLWWMPVKCACEECLSVLCQICETKQNSLWNKFLNFWVCVVSYFSQYRPLIKQPNHWSKLIKLTLKTLPMLKNIMLTLASLVFSRGLENWGKILVETGVVDAKMWWIGSREPQNITRWN